MQTNHDLESRVARLERTNRILSLALVGALGVGAGAAMMGARQSGLGGPPNRGPVGRQDADGPPQRVNYKPVSIVLDPSRSSGRWSSTLMAIDADGRVYSLDTSRPEAFWRRFEFSP